MVPTHGPQAGSHLTQVWGPGQLLHPCVWIHGAFAVHLLSGGHGVRNGGAQVVRSFPPLRISVGDPWWRALQAWCQGYMASSVLW